VGNVLNEGGNKVKKFVVYKFHCERSLPVYYYSDEHGRELPESAILSKMGEFRAYAHEVIVVNVLSIDAVRKFVEDMCKTDEFIANYSRTKLMAMNAPVEVAESRPEPQSLSSILEEMKKKQGERTKRIADMRKEQDVLEDEFDKDGKVVRALELAIENGMGHLDYNKAVELYDKVFHSLPNSHPHKQTMKMRIERAYAQFVADLKAFTK
jgi:hypothetical protein